MINGKNDRQRKKRRFKAYCANIVPKNNKGRLKPYMLEIKMKANATSDICKIGLYIQELPIIKGELHLN